MEKNAKFTEYANSKGFAIHVREDKLSAYMVIRSGAIISEQDVQEFLDELKICNGVQKNIIRGMCRQKIYDYPYLIAFGTPKVDGDGDRIIERYAREHKVNYDIEDNHLNFRNLNYARNIHRNSIIADINIDYKGRDGLDIYNHVIKAREGRPLSTEITLGDNTGISDDGKHIISLIDGNLSFNKEKNAFEVHDTITIEGNVDRSIGNIDFIGNVVVNGDVLGFSITAGGNLTVEGFVEHSKIVCGGDVTIKLGMIGNNQGSIDAKGNVQCDFFENVVFVKSEKNITVNMSIASNLYALGGIKVENDGLLIGGESIAYKAIEAVETGTETNTPTSLMAGVDYRNYHKCLEKEEELEKLKKDLDERNLDVEFLEERKQSYKLTEEEKTKLAEDREAINELEPQIAALRAEIIELKNVFNENCMVYITGTIHPLTKVTLVDKKYLYEHMESNHKLILKSLKLKIIGEFNAVIEEEEEETQEATEASETVVDTEPVEEVVAEIKDPLEERKRALRR